MLRVIIQHLGEMAVIRCVGRIVAGPEADTLRERLRSPSDSGEPWYLTSLVLIRSTAAE